MYRKFNGDLKVGMKVKYGSNNEMSGTITEINYLGDKNKAKIGRWNISRRTDGLWGANNSSGFLLVEGTEKAKFIVTYDRKDRDPYELFATREELDTWIEEALKNDDIINDSIKVYEISGELELKYNVELVKVKVDRPKKKRGPGRPKK